jgi:hypothetical protein
MPVIAALTVLAVILATLAALRALKAPPDGVASGLVMVLLALA